MTCHCGVSDSQTILSRAQVSRRRRRRRRRHCNLLDTPVRTTNNGRGAARRLARQVRSPRCYQVVRLRSEARCELASACSLRIRHSLARHITTLRLRVCAGPAIDARCHNVTITITIVIITVITGRKTSFHLIKATEYRRRRRSRILNFVVDKMAPWKKEEEEEEEEKMMMTMMVVIIITILIPPGGIGPGVKNKEKY